VKNIGENGKIFYIFRNCSFLDNDILILMITIFLILRIL